MADAGRAWPTAVLDRRHPSQRWPRVGKALLLMSESTITREQATQIAAEWAAVSDESVNSHLDVQEVEGGFLVELVVYTGSGPFEPLGSASAVIDEHGHLHEVRAA
jgi:hypothetical protein